MSCGSGSNLAARRNSSTRIARPGPISRLQAPVLIKTGDRSYCVLGEWDSYEKMAAARPGMIAMLDTFRDTLEDLGSGLGVTDPVSGEVVLEM